MRKVIYIILILSYTQVLFSQQNMFSKQIKTNDRQNAEFITYFAIVQDMAENNLTYEELTSEQQQDLQTLAASIYLPSAYARSMLLQYDSSYSYTEPVIFPTISSSRKAKPPIEQKGNNGEVNIYPNPAIDYISVENDLSGEVRIEIIDNTGKVILRKTLKSNIEVIGLNRLSPGSYQILVYQNNELIETKKLSKIK